MTRDKVARPYMSCKSETQRPVYDHRSAPFDAPLNMLRLTTRLNRDDLTQLLGASEQPRVTCYTCHRGAATPETQLPPPAPRPAAAPQPQSSH